MGLLSLGTPLHWEDARGHAEHVRTHGITQFLHTWQRLKDRSGDELLWGDEIEYMIVQLDQAQRNAVLSLSQTDVLAKLSSATARIDMETGAEVIPPTFHPEYGRYMLESTPGAPYTGHVPDLLAVEPSMRMRRAIAREELQTNQRPLTITSFPRLGVGAFTDPPSDPAKALSSRSLFLPEEITNPHARFPYVSILLPFVVHVLRNASYVPHRCFDAAYASLSCSELVMMRSWRALKLVERHAGHRLTFSSTMLRARLSTARD